MMMARRTGQSFLELLQWHPRDFDTWEMLELKAQQDQRFASGQVIGGGG